MMDFCEELMEIPSTSSHTRTTDRYEDPELLARVTVRYSRKGLKMRANWEKEIAKKKRRRKRRQRLSDSSDDELPEQSARRNPRSNPRILRLSTDSKNVRKFEELVFSNSSTITETDHLQQDRPSRRSKKKSRFKPSYVFRNLLYGTNNNEAEEIPCEWEIFKPNLPEDMLSEDQRVLGDIRNVFESEDRLNDSTSQTETLNVQQTVEKDASQDPSDQDNQDCYDWDKFLERWEGVHIVSESTSKAQHLEHMTVKEREGCLRAKRSAKRKDSTRNSSQICPFNGQARKRQNVADSPGTIASTSFKSASYDEEHSSNRILVPSIQTEMEMIVRPVPWDTSETIIASKLEKFIKNTKIKLLKEREIAPFAKKYTSLNHESLPNRTNGSLRSSDPLINLCKNQTQVEENTTGGTNTSTDKMDELTIVERDDDDIEMVS